MKLIIGLGNPGPHYEKSRHNVGFMAIDKIASTLGAQFSDTEKFKAATANLELGGQKVTLAKPMTFMNESGTAAQMLSAFYKLNPETDLLVVHDDTDLPLGKLKPAFDSSSAGHKGVQDIIEKLGTQKFHRLRLGVETRERRDDVPTEAFVLQNFTPEQQQSLSAETLPAAIVEIEKFIKP